MNKLAMKDIDIHNGELADKLQVYADFLLSENEKYNLTAITDRQEIRVRHFEDSILGSVALPQGATVCDIGCGAGFPSLPLKLVRPDISVTLVDSLQKRVDFCRTLCDKLDVEAQFFHDRAEDFCRSHREQFDVATARAVAPLNVLLEYTAPCVKVGGSVVAYKTDTSELDLAANAARTLGVQFCNHFDFVLSDGSRRSLLVFRKISPTPPRYPRPQNKPRKQPL